MAMKTVFSRVGWAPSQLTLQQARSIVSKPMRVARDKPEPWPYLEKPYRSWNVLNDKTTPRLDENSKMVVVEGAHAVGKTKLAKELAEEFNMMYMPPANFDDFYINAYGVDIRDYSDLFPEPFRCFDEKDFFRNPFGGDPGHVDRFLYRQYFLKYLDSLKAVRHILNTGQGVVMESNPFSHYATVNAAFNAGWIERMTRTVFYNAMALTLPNTLKPNVIIYLDAPAEKVQEKIKARGNEWDKNSPIWANTQYLNDIYNEFRNKYLRDQMVNSRILVYDWSEPGDTEIVVEDIEELELDLISAYSEQQKDWKFVNEMRASTIRSEFTDPDKLTEKMNQINHAEDIELSDHLMLSNEVVEDMEAVFQYIKSENYEYGYNVAMGDSLLKILLPFRSDYKNWAPLKFQMHYKAQYRSCLDKYLFPGI